MEHKVQFFWINVKTQWLLMLSPNKCMILKHKSLVVGMFANQVSNSYTRANLKKSSCAWHWNIFGPHMLFTIAWIFAFKAFANLHKVGSFSFLILCCQNLPRLNVQIALWSCGQVWVFQIFCCEHYWTHLWCLIIVLNCYIRVKFVVFHFVGHIYVVHK